MALEGEDARAIRSLAIVPFELRAAERGVLALSSDRKHLFSESNIEFYEAVAQTLGLAIDDRRAQHALRERVKELTCLYAIAQVFEQVNGPVAECLQRVVQVLPPAWQFPRLLVARIRLDEEEYAAGSVDRAVARLQADVLVHGDPRGSVEVGYVEQRAEFVEGAFLEEEEALLGAVAREIGHFVELRESQAEKQRLAEQLRHADRLATLGQLAAGLAHEINEPLGSILGFGQLARRDPQVPEAVARDLDRIVQAALHAREVIRKLMLFARQSPPAPSWVSLNEVVESGLSLLAPRLKERGVEVRRELGASLPPILVDSVQIHQVVVNLCVNGIQAMPQGGTLTVRTKADQVEVELIVEDTGVGIPAEVGDRVFEPFFTTKGPEEGTGLGLSLVQDTVLSHGGTVRFESLNAGTRFVVRLPGVVRSEGRRERPAHE